MARHLAQLRLHEDLCSLIVLQTQSSAFGMEHLGVVFIFLSAHAAAAAAAASVGVFG